MLSLHLLSEDERFLVGFMIESNRIEGIEGCRPVEADALKHFLLTEVLTVPAVSHLVEVFQPGAKLRDRAGMNVTVGAHVPPRGGPLIRKALASLLEEINARHSSPFAVHLAYESLHPFMDGNGRSGRAIWLWQTARRRHEAEQLLLLGFLHCWYYQSLGAWRSADG